MRTAAIAASFVITAASCTFSSAAMRLDETVRMESPAAGSTVRLPVRLDWSVDGPTRTRAAWGVFVDRPPVRPGSNVASVAKGDPGCEPIPGCPDEAYLLAHGIIVTADTEVTLPTIARPARNEPDRHVVTLVALDSQRRRIGDGSWAVSFFIERRTR